MKMQLNILFILIFLNFCIQLYKKNKYNSFSFRKENELSLPIFLKHLDRYYITNKLFTFSCASLFIIGNISIFFILRIFYKINILNMEQQLFKIENEMITINFIYIYKICGYFCLSLAIIIFYKILLNTLFFDEIIKLHLYLNDNKWYEKLQRICKMHYITDFFGSLYLFFFNISKLRSITSLEIEDTEEFDDHSYIYDNAIILYYSKICVILAKKNFIFLWCITILKIIFRWFYIHFRFYHGLIPILPYFIFINISFYAFVTKNTSYILYAFTLLYCSNLFIQLGVFVSKKHNILDFRLFNYFYKNAVPYEKQRILLKNNEKFFVNNFYNSKNNYEVSIHIKDNTLIEYIQDNFEYIQSSSESKTLHKKLKSMYKRWLILIYNFIILLYVMKYTNTFFLKISALNLKLNIIYILIFIYILALFCSNHTCKYKKPSEDTSDFSWTFYTFNQYYNFLFWILMIPQLLLYYILLSMNNISFNNETIIKKFGIKIIRYFTIQEKINYFRELYENMLTLLKEQNYHHTKINILKIFKEELNMLDIITEKTKLKDIRNYLIEILNLYEVSCIKLETILYRIKITIFDYYLTLRKKQIEKSMQLKQSIQIFMKTIINYITILVLKRVSIDVARNVLGFMPPKVAKFLLKGLYYLIKYLNNDKLSL